MISTILQRSGVSTVANYYLFVNSQQYITPQTSKVPEQPERREVKDQGKLGKIRN